MADEGYSPAEGEPITFHISGVEGRTAFGESTDEGATYPTLWSEGDQIKISLGLESDSRSFLKDPETGKSPQVTPSNNGKNAWFTVTIPEQEETYKFYALCPASMWDNDADRAGGLLRVEIPATQSPTTTSCDPLAQLIVATATADVLPESLPLQFSHVAAYGQLTLTGLPEDAIVNTVILTSSEIISGRFFYDMDDSIVDTTTSSTGLSKKITLTTNTKENIWFATLPADLSNTKLTIHVKTSKGEYTKTITLPADRKLVSGRIAQFSVDFTDVLTAPLNRYYLNSPFYENGEPVGIIYWLSEDGQTAKIYSSKRTEEPIQ